MRLLFVCTGNICRSPTAEGVMRRLVDDAGRAGELAVESAGTGGWFAGERADPRAVAAAAARGYVLDGVARQVRVADFAEFDLIVAMDRYNIRALRDLAPDREARAKIRLLLDDDEVPDPFHGSQEDFEYALELIESGCRKLLAQLD